MRHQEHGQICPGVVDQSGVVRGQHHRRTRVQMICDVCVTQALTSGWGVCPQSDRTYRFYRQTDGQRVTCCQKLIINHMRTDMQDKAGLLGPVSTTEPLLRDPRVLSGRRERNQIRRTPHPQQVQLFSQGHCSI